MGASPGGQFYGVDVPPDRPLLGEMRTWRGIVSMSANDPKRTFRAGLPAWHFRQKPRFTTNSAPATSSGRRLDERTDGPSAAQLCRNDAGRVSCEVVGDGLDANLHRSFRLRRIPLRSWALTGASRAIASDELGSFIFSYLTTRITGSDRSHITRDREASSAGVQRQAEAPPLPARSVNPPIPHQVSPLENGNSAS